MRKYFILSTIAIAVVLMFGLPLSANALFMFSSVTYTANSITFTIDGDMIWYAPPQSSYEYQFSIRMPGDIFSGLALGYTRNNWSASVFEYKTFQSQGNLHNDLYTGPYIWSTYNSTLADAFATMNTVTVSWSDNWLDEYATDTTLEFVWGSGSDKVTHTVFATYSATPVAEPATLLLLCIGLAGLAGVSRKKRSN